MAGIIQSILKKVIKEQAGKAFKAQSILNALKNRGVKDSELEASGVKAFVSEFKPNEKVKINDLSKVLDKRTDKLKAADMSTSNYIRIRESSFKKFNPHDEFGTAEQYKPEVIRALGKYARGDMTKGRLINILRDTSNSPGNLTSLSIDNRIEAALKDLATKKNPYSVYTAKVFTKGEPTGVHTHFRSVPDYYSHVRYTDVPNEGRYVHEIQSDVHGAGEKASKVNNGYTQEIAKRAKILQDKYFASSGTEKLKNLTSMLTEGNPPESRVMRSLFVGDYADPSSTLKSRFRRSVMKDLSDLVNIPDYIINEMAPFTAKDPNYLKSTINKVLVDGVNEGQQTVKFRIAEDKDLYRSKGVQNWYETDVVNTLRKTAKKIGAKANMTPDGYMQVDLPKKDFSLPLYSTAGVSVLAASATTKAQAAELPSQLKQARDNGYSDKEIRDYLKSKQYDPNVLDRAFNSKRNFNDVLKGLQ